MEFFNWRGEGVIWCSDESEVVLVLLELGWYISCEITARFKMKILCFEGRREVIAAHFALSTIVLCITDVITGEVM